MKAIIKVIKRAVKDEHGKRVTGWVTQFTIGVQTFTIDNTQPRTKKEALFYAKMLRVAFKNLKNA